MLQKKCDWNGCSEIGLFDGLDKKLLTDHAKKHIFAFLKLIFLCPYHFKLGVGNSYENDSERINIIMSHSDDLIARSQELHKKSHI